MLAISYLNYKRSKGYRRNCKDFTRCFPSLSGRISSIFPPPMWPWLGEFNLWGQWGAANIYWQGGDDHPANFWVSFRRTPSLPHDFSSPLRTSTCILRIPFAPSARLVPVIWFFTHNFRDWLVSLLISFGAYTKRRVTFEFNPWGVRFPRWSCFSWAGNAIMYFRVIISWSWAPWCCCEES